VSGREPARQPGLSGTGERLADSPLPRFVVAVGTDHHPFDRLIVWINDWLAQHPDQIGAFFVQSGAASVAPASASVKFLDADGLGRVLDEADVMICHGGPGSIADAWQRGQVPIVIPRLRLLGEVVDDHQVDFCRKLAGHGRVRLAEDAAAFSALVGEAIADRAGFRLSGPAAEPNRAVEDAVARFEALVNDLISGPRRRLPPILRARRSRRAIHAGDGLSAVAGDPTGQVPPDSPLDSVSRTSAV
jgi:UDP-N-acetylglucosamine transferase subunit ALG13